MSNTVVWKLGNIKKVVSRRSGNTVTLCQYRFIRRSSRERAYQTFLKVSSLLWRKTSSKVSLLVIQSQAASSTQSGVGFVVTMDFKMLCFQFELKACFRYLKTAFQIIPRCLWSWRRGSVHSLHVDYWRDPLSLWLSYSATQGTFPETAWCSCASLAPSPVGSVHPLSTVNIETYWVLRQLRQVESPLDELWTQPAQERILYV